MTSLDSPIRQHRGIFRGNFRKIQDNMKTAFLCIWYNSQSHSNSNLTKSRLPMNYFAVVKLFSNFAQRTAVSQPCPWPNFKTMWQLKCMLGENEILRDLSLRWVLDGYPTLPYITTASSQHKCGLSAIFRLKLQTEIYLTSNGVYILIVPFLWTYATGPWPWLVVNICHQEVLLRSCW